MEFIPGFWRRPSAMSEAEGGLKMPSFPPPSPSGWSGPDRCLYEAVERAVGSISAGSNIILLSPEPISDALRAGFGSLGIDQIHIWPESAEDPPRTARPRAGSTALLLDSSRIAGVSAIRFMLRTRIDRVVCFSPRRDHPRQTGIVPFLISNLLRSLANRVAGLPFLRRRAVFRRGMEWLAGIPFRRLALSRFPVQSECGGGPILYATGSLGAGGSERQLVLTARGVKRELGRDVHVVTQSPLAGEHAFFADEVRKGSIALTAIQSVYRKDREEDIPGLAALNRAFPGDSAIADTIWQFAETIRQVRPAVVHCWLDGVNVAAGIAAVICGVPRIMLGGRSLSPTNFGFYQPYMRAAYRELAALPQVTLLNNSSAGARSYSEWLGIPESSIKVVFNGVEMPGGPDAPKRADAAGPELCDGPVVGMVGRIAEEKRPFLWLDIARIVLQRRPDARFLWVGDGPLREAMVARAQEIGLSGRLLMPGVMSNVANAFSAMTLFLMTSRAEGLPNVSIEAQCFGLPVVIAAVGGAPETIEEGVTGISVEGDRPEKFADAVVRFLDDPVRMSECRTAGPRIAAGKFSVDRMIASTISLYRLDQRQT